MDRNNPRNIILNMLTETLDKGRLSHIVLREVFEKEQPNARDRAFINRTFSGTLETLVRLDYEIGAFSSVPMRKMKPVIRNILRMSLYQMRFMDSVPSYSCINEAVKLTKKRGFGNLSGFVNGLLRTLDSKADSLVLPDHVRCCAPEWIYRLIEDQYGKERTVRFFEKVKEEKDGVYVRLNCTRYSADEIIHTLEKDGCNVQRIPQAEQCFMVSGFDSLTSLDAFQKGMIIMQDPSSVMALEDALRFLNAPSFIIDVCAAPGGKSMFLAEHFPDAAVSARDLSEEKVSLIRQNISRTGLSNIHPAAHDALVSDETVIKKADLVIADLPCSGLGVIGKKPDILYRLKPGDPEELAKLQRSILTVVQEYVKPEGILLYSTCTVTEKENKENADWFRSNFEFEQLQEKQFFPGEDPYDGFYYSVFRKGKA